MSIKQGVRLGQEGYHFRTPGFSKSMVNNLEPQKKNIFVVAESRLAPISKDRCSTNVCAVCLLFESSIGMVLKGSKMLLVPMRIH